MYLNIQYTSLASAMGAVGLENFVAWNNRDFIPNKFFCKLVTAEIL